MPRSHNVRFMLRALSWALVLGLAHSGPANAQSASASASPGVSQYGEATTAGATDIPPALSSNAAGGTESINDALTNEASTSEASATGASPFEASKGEAPPSKTSSSGASAPAGSAEEELLTLPETGGAPLASLFAGASTLVLALLLLRSNLRRD